MNKEANENWINTYIKNNPFRFKETIIHQCRQMDKADVYEWIADNELKIIHLQQKVNQLETNRDEAIELLSKGVAFCENDSQGAYDVCNNAINREKKAIEILRRGK